MQNAAIRSATDDGQIGVLGPRAVELVLDLRGEIWRQLEPGMVLTIEPGLYVPPGTRGIPPEFRNVGIRIEDDVLVTREGHEVLTDGVPKEPVAIEAVMAA